MLRALSADLVYDSHCHLHDHRVLDPDAAIARARSVGVRGFLLAGVDPRGWEDGDRLAAKHGDAAVSVGVHPQIVAEVDEATAASMIRALEERLARRDLPRVVAVGEIGLDGVGERKESLPLQEIIFRAQLAIARDAELPISLHILRAHGRALAVLEGDGPPRRGGVVHSYSGDPELVRRYLKLGLHLSFAGGVTRIESRRVRSSVALVPREHLLVETDAPDQTPAPHHPAQNEPAFLVAVVATVAALRNETAADVAAYTEKNARALLGIASE